MKFKYLSLCLCLSLFACSDDENILPEEKPAVPQGEPMEDTPIVQKDYISNSSLWMGPSLANDGFVVEVEMGAESSARSTERTKKSIEHYNMGVHQSPLPEIKAAEWGYTVLNLPTGQTDGAGRVIDNIYLDNKASINDRKTALETIMRFVKKQYRVEDSSTPWYSMNGHYCWHHYAGASGATVLASEIGENIHGYQLHIAMNRGAARQYSKPWVIDFSSWHGASILDYSKSKIWKEYSGPKHGHSINLVERSMLMSYMAGADGVVAEGGGAICFYDDITADDCYKLSPYGKVFQKLYQFSKTHSNVGITYTPFAVLLDQFHGMDRQPAGQQVFGKFGYNQGDMETFNLIETLWPQTFSVEKNGNEIGSMVNSKYQIQLGNLDTSHQPVTIWIKDLIVRMTENIILFVKSIYDRIDLMLRVIFLSLLPELFVLVIRQITDGFIVLGYKLRISVLVPVITDRWVSKDTRTDEKK